MTTLHSNYADIMRDKKILYIPSCMVVEMLTKLYSQVSYIKTSTDLKDTAEDLLGLLERMSENIELTVNAFREGRITAFIGDWTNDKLRARRSFFNILSRLGNLTERLNEEDREKIHEAIKELTGGWLELDSIMRANSQKLPEVCAGRSCKSDDCDRGTCWHKALAKRVLTLDATAEYDDDDTYLILLCYKQIKDVLVDEINDIRRKSKKTDSFPFDRIICTSDEEVSIDCPKCIQMSDSFRRDATTIIHNSYSNVRHSQRRQASPSPVQEFPAP